MKRGIALSDKDRIPWLETLRNALREYLLSNNTVVLGCSALQKNYREILRSADPHYEHGSFESMVKFVLLDARAEVIAARLEKRAAEGNHFMPPNLLQSQLDSLQLDPSEGILKVDATQSPDDTVNGIQALIFWSSIPQTKIRYSRPYLVEMKRSFILFYFLFLFNLIQVEDGCIKHDWLVSKSHQIHFHVFFVTRCNWTRAFALWIYRQEVKRNP